MKEHYTDEELVALIKSKDKKKVNEAAEFLYRRDYEIISKWLLQRGIPPVIQVADIFLPALQKLILQIQIGKIIIDKRKRIKSFLFENCDWIRLNKLRSTRNQNNLKDNLPLPPKIENENILTDMIKGERKKFVAALISRMGKKCQDSLIMSYFKKIKHSAQAEILKLKNAGVSRNRLSNCKKELRKMILNNPDWEDFLKP